ncbi:MAG: hypothetical protein ACK56F_04035, partial [bacterium]
ISSPVAMLRVARICRTHQKTDAHCTVLLANLNPGCGPVGTNIPCVILVAASSCIGEHSQVVNAGSVKNKEVPARPCHALLTWL